MPSGNNPDVLLVALVIDVILEQDVRRPRLHLALQDVQPQDLFEVYGRREQKKRKTLPCTGVEMHVTLVPCVMCATYRPRFLPTSALRTRHPRSTLQFDGKKELLMSTPMYPHAVWLNFLRCTGGGEVEQHPDQR